MFGCNLRRFIMVSVVLSLSLIIFQSSQSFGKAEVEIHGQCRL